MSRHPNCKSPLWAQGGKEPQRGLHEGRDTLGLSQRPVQRGTEKTTLERNTPPRRANCDGLRWAGGRDDVDGVKTPQVIHKSCSKPIDVGYDFAPYVITKPVGRGGK